MSHFTTTNKDINSLIIHIFDSERTTETGVIKIQNSFRNMFGYVVLLTTICFTFRGSGLSQEGKAEHYDILQNINRVASMVKSINKSPKSFAMYTKTAAKLLTAGNIFNYVNSGHNMTTYNRDDVGTENFVAENVTDVPLNSTTESTETTVSPTPTISELCLNHSQLVSQALQRQDYWAMRSKDL